MTIHRLAEYRDGHQSISYCLICSAEGLRLQDPCVGPIEACQDCGHVNFDLVCKNCDRIKLKFKKAIDKTKERS